MVHHLKSKDSKGNYVVQKVGGKKYDTFTTNSKNVVTVKDAEEGTVTLPLQLDAGDYSIEEVETPKGFLQLEQSVKIYKLQIQEIMTKMRMKIQF